MSSNVWAAVRHGRAWLAGTGAVYLGLMGSLFTGVYHPFAVGRDRSWLLLVVLVAAHLGLGASWQTKWRLVLPCAVAVVGIAAALGNGDAYGAVLVGMAGLVGCALVAIGGLVARRLRHLATGRVAPIAAPVVMFALAAVPLGQAARESHHLATGPRLSAAEAQRLPLDEYALNTLCDQQLPPRARRPPAERAAIQAQGHALAEETRRHGDHVVRVTYDPADEPGIGHELMTVRQLAENQLGALRRFGGCEPALQRELAAALD